MLRTLFISVLFFLTSCGGGSISISTSEEAYRSPVGVLSELERQVHNKDEAQRILHGLREKMGDNLDWAKFWSILSVSSQLQNLLENYTEPLLSLHARNCHDESFTEFARLVLKAKRGWEYVLGDKNQCQAALPVPLSVQLFNNFLQTEESNNDQNSANALEGAIGFLNQQLKANPSGDWVDYVLNPSFVMDLDHTIGRIFEEKNSTVTADFAVNFQKVTGVTIAWQHLQDQFFKRPIFLKEYIKELGPLDALKSLNIIFSKLSTTRTWIYSPIQSEGFLETLLSTVLHDMNLNIHHSHALYIQYKSLLSKVTAFWNPIRKIDAYHKLQDSFENVLSGVNEEELDHFFSEILSLSKPHNGMLDTLWLIHRTRNNHNYFTGAVKNYFSEIKYTSSYDLFDRVLHSRLSVHFANSMKEKKDSLTQFCSVLESEGILEKTLTESDFRDLVNKGTIDAGCFKVSTKNDSFHFKTNHPFITTHDTAIRFPSKTVEIISPEISVGMIDTSAESEEDDSNPNGKPILVLPVLLHLFQSDTVSPIPYGSQIFVVHVPIKTSEQKLTKIQLNRGAQGGSLHLSSFNQIKPFGFVSLGAMGEFHPIADISELNLKLLNQSRQAIHSMVSLSIEQPITWYDTLNAEQFEVIWRQKNEIRIPLGLYLGILSSNQIKKLDTICDPKVNLNQCVDNKVLPMAISYISQFMEGKSFKPTETIEIFDSLSPFVWPKGTDDQFESMGPRGMNGELKLLAFKE